QRAWLERTIELLAMQQSFGSRTAGSVSLNADDRIEASLAASGAGSGFYELALLSLTQVRDALIDRIGDVRDGPTRMHMAAMIGRTSSLIGAPSPTANMPAGEGTVGPTAQDAPQPSTLPMESIDQSRVPFSRMRQGWADSYTPYGHWRNYVDTPLAFFAPPVSGLRAFANDALEASGGPGADLLDP
ncbi:MAG: hypothetical protein AAFX92_07805, partial [Pseudomonadota bacterium]